MALAGFFLTGLLLSFPGAALPAWRFHLSSDYIGAGVYFLLLNAGLLVSMRAGQTVVTRRGPAFTASLGAFLAAGGLLFLAVTGSASPYWRLPGLFWLGMASGLLSIGLLEGVSPLYRLDGAATLNLAGVVFGLGCVTTALLVAGTFYVYSAPAILALLAVFPAVFGLVFAKARLTRAEPSPADAELLTRQLRSPAAILLALLLFFQFANEWSIAGWLPLFLIQRLGISPARSIFMLALYWGALLSGRVLAQALLARIRHGRLLLLSAAAALFGCVLLSFTDNMSGAVAGILFTGAGFASIFPLTAEKIGSRFPYYSPSVYSGLFSLAFTGAMLAPWSIGFMAEWWGIRAMMIVPLLGTCMVFLLLAMIVLEARLSEGQAAG